MRIVTFLESTDVSNRNLLQLRPSNWSKLIQFPVTTQNNLSAFKAPNSRPGVPRHLRRDLVPASPSLQEGSCMQGKHRPENSGTDKAYFTPAAQSHETSMQIMHFVMSHARTSAWRSLLWEWHTRANTISFTPTEKAHPYKHKRCSGYWGVSFTGLYRIWRKSVRQFRTQRCGQTDGKRACLDIRRHLLLRKKRPTSKDT